MNVAHVHFSMGRMEPIRGKVGRVLPSMVVLSQITMLQKVGIAGVQPYIFFDICIYINICSYKTCYIVKNVSFGSKDSTPNQACQAVQEQCFLLKYRILEPRHFTITLMLPANQDRKSRRNNPAPKVGPRLYWSYMSFSVQTTAERGNDEAFHTTQSKMLVHQRVVII